MEWHHVLSPTPRLQWGLLWLPWLGHPILFHIVSLGHNKKRLYINWSSPQKVVLVPGQSSQKGLAEFYKQVLGGGIFWPKWPFPYARTTWEGFFAQNDHSLMTGPVVGDFFNKLTIPSWQVQLMTIPYQTRNMTEGVFAYPPPCWDEVPKTMGFFYNSPYVIYKRDSQKLN